MQLPTLRPKPLRYALTACAALAFSASAQAPLDIRIALVIGNAAYAGNAALANPANDAKAMGETLKQLGFTVVEVRDGSKAQMTEAVAKVRDTLKGKQGVGMLYYAGHGLQLDWRNYMVPVDAKLSKAADVAEQTVDLNSVIDAFKAAGNRMNIVVLDACRDNPFAGNTANGKGLAQLDAPPGTFLAYATAPGNVAEDGDVKSGNGLYTQYLLQELRRPTAKIEDVFKRVRLNVRRASDGRQIPWESTSLEDDFYFNDGTKLNARAEDLDRLAAETRQKELALQRQAAQAHEREQQLALQIERERLRLAAEQRLAEEQDRKLAQDKARREADEQARRLAQEKAQREALEQAMRLAENQRVAELQRLAEEQRRVQAQEQARRRAEDEQARRIAEDQVREREQQLALAREREQQIALAQQQERERTQAAAKALESARKAEAERARELEQARVAAATRPSERISKEEQLERLFKAQKADWDRIKTSNRAEDFYAFLDKYPGNSELGEEAQYRLDQLAKPKIQAALGQGQSASLAYSGPRFKVGDIYKFEASDLVTKVSEGVSTRRVTAINGDIVEINGGQIAFSMLSGRIKDRLGSYDPPSGQMPVELQVGKSWAGKSIQNNINGQIFQITSQAKVTGRETITVPAGTFQTYVVEGVNFVSNGAVRRVKFWVDPRYGLPIRSELIGRRNNGIIDRSEKLELVAVEADRN